MDDSTHSVYLAIQEGKRWYAWSEKTGNGGGCSGEMLGSWYEGGGCHNLDSSYGRRVKCVSTHS